MLKGLKELFLGETQSVLKKKAENRKADTLAAGRIAISLIETGETEKLENLLSAVELSGAVVDYVIKAAIETDNLPALQAVQKNARRSNECSIAFARATGINDRRGEGYELRTTHVLPLAIRSGAKKIALAVAQDPEVSHELQGYVSLYCGGKIRDDFEFLPGKEHSFQAKEQLPYELAMHFNMPEVALVLAERMVKKAQLAVQMKNRLPMPPANDTVM